MHSAYYNSPVGWLKISGDEDGLASVSFCEDATDGPAVNHPCLQACITQLDEYFSGTRSIFSLKLNPAGTAFQQQVWEALRDIPYGKTASYGEVAKSVGNAKASRAVGGANNRNPLPVIIPCHRVVGSDHSLTGYAGGLDKKRWLLAHEKKIAA